MGNEDKTVQDRQKEREAEYDEAMARAKIERAIERYTRLAGGVKKDDRE